MIMKPLQVYIDDVDFQRLDAWSRERGWTKSQAVRAAVRALTRRVKEEDPLLELSGTILDRLPRDASEKFDYYLQHTFVAEHAPAYRKSRHRSRTRSRR